MIDTTLAARTARYIAQHLVAMRYLVATDPEGYELALALARAAGPDVDALLRERLDPLVERSIEVGQSPPQGW
jgi:predicted HD phosphohydrolase